MTMNKATLTIIRNSKTATAATATSINIAFQETDATRLHLVMLWVFLLSLFSSALMGIIGIISGRVGDKHYRILLTSITIMIGSLLILVCTPALRRSTIGTNRCSAWFHFYVGIFGSLCALLAMILVQPIIYQSYGTYFDPEYWKATISFILWSFIFAYTSLMSGCNFANVWLVVIADLCFVTTMAFYWYGVLKGGLDMPWKLIYCLNVLSSFLTVLVPVLHFYNLFCRPVKDDNGNGNGNGNGRLDSEDREDKHKTIHIPTTTTATPTNDEEVDVEAAVVSAVAVAVASVVADKQGERNVGIPSSKGDDNDKENDKDDV